MGSFFLLLVSVAKDSDIVLQSLSALSSLAETSSIETFSLDKLSETSSLDFLSSDTLLSKTSLEYKLTPIILFGTLFQLLEEEKEDSKSIGT